MDVMLSEAVTFGELPLVDSAKEPSDNQGYQFYICTVWKLHEFCIIQILREINFEDS